MKAHVFAEGSNTTAEDRDLPLVEYYEGLFGTVAGLQEELADHTDTTLHVLSEEFGAARGHERVADLETRGTPVGFEEMTAAAREELRGAATDADVMVVLLSTDVFEMTVGEAWPDLVEAAKPGSIWCLSAARSALEELDLEALETDGRTVLTYERRGVARIGTETREQLLETVTQTATQ
ncbi:hypothetical protein [Natronobeatus ordinarius]|uniref:hypothetical protein n=1 Tax=Natronobeatus ordinarius TaxID=2963433 RepID=UPI0020CB8BF6|nr:hypothetical protein [Natronobeatus ordinarius]